MTQTTQAAQFTRKAYLNNECTHRQYYGQFVDAAMKQRVMQRFGIDRIKEALKEGENLNTIPLAKWDAIASPTTGHASQLMRLAGDYPTLAGAVCIAKEAARQLAETI